MFQNRVKKHLLQSGGPGLSGREKKSSLSQVKKKGKGNPRVSQGSRGKSSGHCEGKGKGSGTKGK